MEKWSNLAVSILKTEIKKKNSSHLHNSNKNLFGLLTVSSSDVTLNNCVCAWGLGRLITVLDVPVT